MTRWVPCLSCAGRLISSQKMTSQGPICTGARTTPLGVFVYSQYCSKVFKISSGVVALEKLRPTTSMPGSLRRAPKRVTVFPEPGGPQRMRGLCSDNHEYSISSWRTVSTVGTTTSDAVTECASISIEGTLECHVTYSPVVIWTSKSMSEFLTAIGGRSTPIFSQELAHLCTQV